jgi:GNAT superfamily N-acetyltransferase
VSAVRVPTADLRFREGRAGDLTATFAIAARAIHDTARRQGIVSADSAPSDAEIRSRWLRQRSLVEFVAAQPGGSFWVCDGGEEPVGFARATKFGEMEELTELMVMPSHHGRGIGRALLERCWPDDPTPDLGRVVVAAGAPADLSLYTNFGVMPITGHWHLRMRAEDYLERRSHEIDATEPAVHVLEPGRAATEWKRLEPPAIGHERPLLHEFFGRARTCLACMDEQTGEAAALCWVSTEGEIGPAVGATAEDLVPVVLAALDRVAKAREPEWFGVFCTTDSWWLLRRLRGLGFHVFWPSWVMCSVPLPGLDRYLPTRPPHVL